MRLIARESRGGFFADAWCVAVVMVPRFLEGGSPVSAARRLLYGCTAFPVQACPYGHFQYVVRE
ncbi:hypothetical protein T261_0995 [Streptomyces lydicus]|nr:hypothetical protein T261_0995 [Streptomyces lydicus]